MAERFLLEVIILGQLSCEKKYVVSTIVENSCKLLSAECGVSHSQTLVYSEKREIHWSQVVFDCRTLLHHQFPSISFANVAIRSLLLVHNTDFKVLLILSPSGINTELFLDIVIDIEKDIKLFCLLRVNSFTFPEFQLTPR
jgi:hypothetical protein